MFKLSTSKDYVYPVEFHAVGDDGISRKHRIKARFLRLTADEIQELNSTDEAIAYADALERALEKAGGDKVSANILAMADLARNGKKPPTSTDRARDLMRFLIGWEDVADESGPMEFSESALANLINQVPDFYVGVKDAHLKASSGGAREKN